MWSDYLLVDTVCSGDDPLSIYKGTATGDLLIEVLPLNNGSLPGNLTILDIVSSDNFGRSGVDFAAL